MKHPFSDNRINKKIIIMKKITLAMLLVLHSSIVFADEYNWNGIYAGGSFGAINGDNKWKFIDAGTEPSPNPIKSDGGALGGFIGYQKEFNRLVLGIEGQAYISNYKGTSSCPNNSFNCEVKNNNFWFIGPKVGYKADNILMYGLLGYTQARIKGYATLLSDNSLSDVMTKDHHGLGVGLGIDFAYKEHMIFGLQYLHANLNTKLHDTQDYGGTNMYNLDENFNLITARIGYKF